MKKLDSTLIMPGLFIVATSYGLARYAYGLFLPVFRTAFALDDATLAYVAAISYGSYFIVTMIGIYLSTNLAPRLSVLLGGLAAVIGMGIVALAQGPATLAIGIAVAGVSPGLAYTPFSEIVSTLVTAERQRRIYSVINSGTSLGVLISGPSAILLGEQWRFAWGCFAVFGLLSTLWCVSVLPKIAFRERPLSFADFSVGILLSAPRRRLFLAAFLIGIATSIYWAFSVDLVTAGRSEGLFLFGYKLTITDFGRVFWTFVGLSGFVGMKAGAIVERTGVISAMRLFLMGIAVSAALIALDREPAAVLLSGLIFGAFFVLLSATLGMWSMALFRDFPALGFGTAFLLLSVGQVAGPLIVGSLIGRVALSSMFLASAIFSVFLSTILSRRALEPATP